MIVTIDGPAGSGKSSTAKAAANRTGWHYLDSGALYRVYTLLFNRYKGDTSDFLNKMDDHTIELKTLGSDTFPMLDGKKVGDSIRASEVSANVSTVAAMEPVRKAVNAVMRKAVRKADFVADGRDLGTVVFPDAAAKFYLVADLDERAHRRYAELKVKGLDADLQEIKDNLTERDRIDSSREIAPLKKPDDAELINTTDLDFEEQVEIIVRKIQALKK